MLIQHGNNLIFFYYSLIESDPAHLLAHRHAENLPCRSVLRGPLQAAHRRDHNGAAGGVHLLSHSRLRAPTKAGEVYKDGNCEQPCQSERPWRICNFFPPPVYRFTLIQYRCSGSSATPPLVRLSISWRTPPSGAAYRCVRGIRDFLNFLTYYVVWQYLLRGDLRSWTRICTDVELLLLYVLELEKVGDVDVLLIVF